MGEGKGKGGGGSVEEGERGRFNRSERWSFSLFGRFQVGGESSLQILEVILKRDSFEKFNYQRRRNRIFEYI